LIPDNIFLTSMPLTPVQFPSTPAPSGGGAPGPSYGPDFEDEEEGGLDFRRYLSALWRHRFLILGLGVLGFAGGYGLSRVVKPVYEAQASVQIPAGRGQAMQPGIRSAPLFEGRGWLELLRSFEVLDEVVRRRMLFLELAVLADSQLFSGFELSNRFSPGEYQLTGLPGGRLRLEVRNGPVVDERAVGDSVGLPLGFRWVPGALPPERVVSFRVRVPRDAAVRLGNDLVTQLPPEGALLRMSLRGIDPEFTAATINALANRFVEVATLLKREKLTTNTSVLRERLESARADLSSAERALEQFKVSTITLPSDRGAPAIASGLAETRDPVRQAFFRLRLDREELTRDRDAIQRALASVSDTSRSIITALNIIPAVRESRELTASLNSLTDREVEVRQMRLAFAPSHAPLRQLERRIDELRTRTIPDQAGALIQSLNTRIADIDQRIAASSREMQQIPIRSTEEARRERNVDVAQLIYTELQSAYEQARLSELSAEPDVRLLDSAVPPTRPVQDQMIIIIFGGGLAGFGLGVLLAIALDRFDRRIRYPDQVTKDLGLPILGALPLLRRGRDGRVMAGDDEQLVEAMRSVRMALLYAHGTAGPFVITVTSPGSGDGKSFVSSQLARSFAMSGRRTLLVDGDNRRGFLHRTFNVQRKPGLMDLLAGTATREQAVHHVEDGGFDLIPAGTHRRIAPELLAAPEMARLMMELRADYQAIILDSPPLGAGVDPLVLASLSGTLVLVLRNGVTDREFAGARLGDLERLPIRLLGAILNDVRTEGVYKYYSYLPGYRTEDEGSEQIVDPPKKRRLLGPR
jgi:polysaccharide biosynthesis transport protein